MSGGATVVAAPCSVCGRPFELVKQGVIAPHRPSPAWRIVGEGAERVRGLCHGSRRPPRRADDES